MYLFSIFEEIENNTGLVFDNFGQNRIYWDFYVVFDLITCYLSYTRKGSIIHALLA